MSFQRQVSQALDTEHRANIDLLGRVEQAFARAGRAGMARDAELGKLRNGKYFAVHVPPGKHDYTVHSESKDVLTIEAEAGETYYVSGSIGMGIMVGRPNLSPADQAAFEAAKPKMKEVAPMSGD